MNIRIPLLFFAAILAPSLAHAESGWWWRGMPAGIYQWADETKTITLTLDLNSVYSLESRQSNTASTLRSKSDPENWIVFQERGTWLYRDKALSLELTPTGKKKLWQTLPKEIGASRSFRKVSDGQTTLFVTKDPESDFCLRLKQSTIQKPDHSPEPAPGAAH